MIERKFVAERIKEFQVQSFVRDSLKNAGVSHTKMQRTPLGEKIVIYTSRPGLVVGRKGQNINQLTKTLKKEFGLENPQIEISEVENVGLNPNIMAEKIVNFMEKFGTANFKGIGHKVMSEVMNAGALGVELIISGKIPSSRAKSWRFFSGYLKKCGDNSLGGVLKAYGTAKLKTGIIGVKVSITPPDVKMPDDIQLIEEKKEVVEEIKKEEKEAKEEETKIEEKKEEPKKKGVKEKNKDKDESQRNKGNE